jgi:hypothetical protein
MKRVFVLVAILSATFLAAQPAAAQCPSGVSAPLQAFVGAWSFKMEGVAADGYVSAGSFKASVVPKGTGSAGALLVSSTAIKSGTVVRQDNFSGTFDVNADCSGGSFSFKTNLYSVTVDFWFTSGLTKIYFVSSDPALSVSGEAART